MRCGGDVAQFSVSLLRSAAGRLVVPAVGGHDTLAPIGDLRDASVPSWIFRHERPEDLAANGPQLIEVDTVDA